ncbi:hypothetical protein [Erythrobacter sp.]|uniref:hypothetical protein n=1 Tax=Erythrobacter sp. TaxID=1042 RepID=UPI001425DA0D|nr:hypothetical protein [Erythrobacter sp.]QIQ87521.1 MAG: hypothetical protein G9473_13145 [Erythrobacter sp.]
MGFSGSRKEIGDALRSLFSLAEHLWRLSKDGDSLEVLAGMVQFERFRPLLVKGLGYGGGAKGSRPPFDPVAMFKVLVFIRKPTVASAADSDGRQLRTTSVRRTGYRPSVQSIRNEAIFRGMMHLNQSATNAM